MTNGYFASHEMEAERPSSGSVSPVASAFRDVLERHVAGPLGSTELRAGLRPIVRRARDAGFTIEQLLVVVKREWLTLPGTRVAQGERSETARRLERAVTLVIETYYEA